MSLWQFFVLQLHTEEMRFSRLKVGDAEDIGSLSIVKIPTSETNKPPAFIIIDRFAKYDWNL